MRPVALIGDYDVTQAFYWAYLQDEPAPKENGSGAEVYETRGGEFFLAAQQPSTKCKGRPLAGITAARGEVFESHDELRAWLSQRCSDLAARLKKKNPAW